MSDRYMEIAKEIVLLGRTHLLKNIASALRRVRNEVIESQEIKELSEFLTHGYECILSHWEAGEPTPDGGYRSKYAGKWYESKPADKTPKCNCGLDEALSNFENMRREMKE